MKASCLRGLALALLCGAVGGSGGLARAAEVIPPASERFAAADIQEVPSLQRHVLPLMGRLGCNGRACHGSFQGQGGFRLSLFGYDFKMDHEALTAGDEPRVSLKQPRESLILSKPTGTDDDHGGGHRLDVDSWEYRVILRWIESGAKAVDEANTAQFVRLEVTPQEIVFRATGEKSQLRVLSHWSDGTVEDVTPLCRFQSNDDSVATISPTGQVVSAGKGDTHVVAFYDNGVVPVPVLLPVSEQHGERFPKVATPTKIDALIAEKLRKLGVVPSGLCTDEEFLRRASLDIAGQLPSPDEVLAFAADKSPDKRARKIDELLERPGYAAWWSTKLCDLTGNNERNGDQVFRTETYQQWYRWIYRRVAENAPYDQLVEGIVLATSRTSPDQSFEDYCEEMVSYVRKDDPADFAARDTMPHYWARRNVRTANEKALSFSHAFLGVRLQCAECHKHPFDQWSQYDFQSFTAFFGAVNYGTRRDSTDEYRALMDKVLGGRDTKKLNGGEQRRIIAELARDGKLTPIQEVYIATERIASTKKGDKSKVQGGSRVITPRVLGGEEVLLSEYSDPRSPLMDWLRSPENPYFAKAFVNRVWSHYFGVGIVEPPDDMNLANAPSNAALLDWLADEFIRHEFDMKWLHRTICNSRAYQLSWETNDTNRTDSRNFARALPRRLPAEVVYDAVVDATAGSKQLAARRADPITLCSVGLSMGYTQGAGRSRGYALTVFGKPLRETPCDCERSNEATLLQTVFLRNDSDMLALIDARDGWVAEMAARYGWGDAAKSEASGREQADLVRRRNSTLAKLESLERELDKVKKRGDKKSVAKVEKLLDETREQLDKLQARLQELEARPAAGDGSADVSELVRQAYLRTLSRLPTDEEAAEAAAHLSAAEDKLAALRDLVWALLNTKEFVVNH